MIVGMPGAGKTTLAVHWAYRNLPSYPDGQLYVKVRPLLPGEGQCAVLATSRDQMSGLVARDGARRVPLAPLREHDAIDLLASLIREERPTDSAAALRELAVLCARGFVREFWDLGSGSHLVKATFELPVRLVTSPPRSRASLTGASGPARRPGSLCRFAPSRRFYYHEMWNGAHITRTKPRALAPRPADRSRACTEPSLGVHWGPGS